MNGSTRTRSVAAPQLIIGLTLLLAGVALLLDNFGLIHASVVLRLWPVGLILIGLSSLAQRRSTSGRFAGLFWIFVGTWLLLGNLKVLRLSVWDLWPVPVVVAGIYMVWQALHGPERPSGADDSTFSAMAVMAGVGRKINSAQFRGGDATALLGGVKIDLQDAQIGGDEAIVDVFAFWGGIEMTVPEGWAVINRVVAVLGGADDRTRPPAVPSAKRLVIRGFCLMGGVEIKSA